MENHGTSPFKNGKSSNYVNGSSIPKLCFPSVLRTFETVECILHSGPCRVVLHQELQVYARSRGIAPPKIGILSRYEIVDFLIIEINPLTGLVHFRENRNRKPWLSAPNIPLNPADLPTKSGIIPRDPWKVTTKNNPVVQSPGTQAGSLKKNTNNHHVSGVGKCPFLRILNITFPYLLEMKNPQYLGDFQLGHLPTPGGGSPTNRCQVSWLPQWLATAGRLAAETQQDAARLATTMGLPVGWAKDGCLRCAVWVCFAHQPKLYILYIYI